jgi:hypothetical protein
MPEPVVITTEMLRESITVLYLERATYLNDLAQAFADAMDAGVRGQRARVIEGRFTGVKGGENDQEVGDPGGAPAAGGA